MQTGLATGAVITQPGKKVATSPKALGKSSVGGNLNSANGNWNDPISISFD